jgi:3-(3-hydroxy-phenyl)propionate hydroxylase
VCVCSVLGYDDVSRSRVVCGLRVASGRGTAPLATGSRDRHRIRRVFERENATVCAAEQDRRDATQSRRRCSRCMFTQPTGRFAPEGPEMRYDAVIVGYGPVGATLAMLLSRGGLRVAIVEKRPTMFDKPRAITLDHEVMRAFQACGIADEIEPITAPHTGTHFLGMSGQIIKIFDPLPPPHPLGWPPSGTFIQPELEQILRSAVGLRPNIDVFLAHEAIGIVQHPSEVNLAIRDLRQAGQRTLKCRYLLGCDGANSFVRTALAAGEEDLAFDEWWIVVDAWLHRQPAAREKSLQYCWPSRPGTFVVGPRNLRRWEIKLLPGERPEDFNSEPSVLAMLGRFTDPASIDIWRWAVYRFHAAVAERWQQDRVFLLGDAAHQMPPFLGQGLCAGIRDAVNLAWKLIAVLRQGVDAVLLESYQRERRPHVRAIVEAAKAFGRIVGELDPAAAVARDAELAGQLARGEAETIRQRYIPGLTVGIIATDPTGNPEQAAGSLFVQPRIRASNGKTSRFDDIIKPRFLLATTRSQAQSWLSPSSLRLLQRLDAEQVVITEEEGVEQSPIHHVIETEGLFASWAKQQACDAVVVRPDRYVYGVASDAGTLNALVERLHRSLFPKSTACP